MLELDGLRTELRLGDGALGAFLQSGDAATLAAAREAETRAADHLEIVQALTAHEPPQRALGQQLEPSFAAWRGAAHALVAARQAGDERAARALREADAAGAALRALLLTIEKLRATALELLSARDTASFLQAQSTRWSVWSGVTVNLFLLVGAGWLIRDDLAARRRAHRALQEANAGLETRVVARTTELAETNMRLAAENLERRWAQQSLAHQLRYQSIIVDSITDLVFVLTKAQSISRVNPAVLQALGQPETAMIGQPLARFVRLPINADEPAAPDPVARALKDGRETCGLAATIEDRLIALRVAVFPLRDGDQVVGGVVVAHVVGSAAPASPQRHRLPRP
jgi:PAS domain-containing protein